MTQTNYGHFINCEYQQQASGEYIDSINPATQSVVAKIAKGNESDANQAVAAAKSACEAWASLRPLDRGRILIDIPAKRTVK